MIVQMPDKQQVWFPDDYPAEKVREFIKQHYPEADKTWSGSVLPFSSDAAGKLKFDLGAGITGAIGRGASLPREVYEGKVDPLSGQGVDRAMELGGLAFPANRSLYLGTRTGPLAAPSRGALDEAAESGYNRVREMGVHYSSDAVGETARSLRAQLEADGILEVLAPKTFSILKQLESPPAGSTAPLAGIEAARRALGNARKDFTNPTEQLAAARLADGLDEFVMGRSRSSGDVLEGPAAEAATELEAARGNYAAARRSETVTGTGGAEERAELAAKAVNSGANLDNALRQQFKSILNDPKKRAGYSKYELALMNSIVRGNASRNTLRVLGNLLGGGGGMGAALVSTIGATAGSALGGPGIAIGASLPLVGAGIKTAANTLARRGVDKLDEATRKRSPLFQQMQADAPPRSWGRPTAQSMLARGLLSLAVPQVADPRVRGLLDTRGKPLPPGSIIY